MSSTDTPKSSAPSSSNTLREIILWRKKTQSLVVLLVSTITWILLEVYQFNFLTVLSWLSMIVVSSMFLWGNLVRLLGKEPPDLSRSKMREESATRLAMTLRAWTEKGIKLMYKFGAESDVFSFVLTVGGLWLVSQVGHLFDLLTLIYAGILFGMTGTPIYVRYEESIKKSGERIKGVMKRYNEMFDEKFIKKLKNKVTTKSPTSSATVEKMKKVE